MRKPQLTKRRTKVIIVLSILAAIICIAIAPQIRENESAIDAWTLLHVATNLVLGIVCAVMYMHYRRVGVAFTAVYLSIELLLYFGIFGIIGWEVLEQDILNHIWADAGESLLNTVTDIFIGLAVFLVSFGWTLHRLRQRGR